jgi:hypothetical protein
MTNKLMDTFFKRAIYTSSIIINLFFIGVYVMIGVTNDI